MRYRLLNSLCIALWQEAVGEPYAGNPHVRFDEGEQYVAASGRGGLLPTLLHQFEGADH